MLTAPEVLIANTMLVVMHKFFYLGSIVSDNLSLDDKLNSHIEKAATVGQQKTYIEKQRYKFTRHAF